MAKKIHRTKKQHYVAQFYLNGFANQKSALWCYDKVTGVSYPTNIKSIAQESNFYEIASGTTNTPIPDNAVENRLGKIESLGAKQLRNLIQSANNDQINLPELEEFCNFIALQWIRTKTHRDTMYEVMSKGLQAIADDLVWVNFPGLTPPQVKLCEKVIPAMHAEQMFHPEMIPLISKALRRHIIIVGVNLTDKLFYTSDHPVVRNPNRSDSTRKFLGFNDPGIEIAFPLDKRHILRFLEKEHFSRFKKYDARPMQMTPELVLKYNELQVRHSCQRIFSFDEDFGVAHSLCASEPAICNPQRPRVRVGTTPMVQTGPSELRNYNYIIALE